MMGSDAHNRLPRLHSGKESEAGDTRKSGFDPGSGRSRG